MTVDQQLIDLIGKMQDRLEVNQRETNEHLTKLRESMHEIKNDYHGQASMVKMIYKDVETIKGQQEKDLETVHSRIHKHVTELEADMKNVVERLTKIEPMAVQFGKLYDNASRVVVGAFVIALLAASAAYIGGS